jgi:excisionase family DNA binding protein
MARKWLTPAEAARRLRVSESTIWRFLRREQLTSVKVDGRRRIPAGAIGRVARSVRSLGARDVAPLTLDNVLFALAGSFRSDGMGPGSADKHRYVGAKP